MATDVPNLVLGIEFSGLSVVLLNKRRLDAARQADIVLPAAHKMKLGLCEHHPVLCFPDKILTERAFPEKELWRLRSHVSHDGHAVGLCDLTGLELAIEGVESAKPALAVERSIRSVLGFDSFEPGLGLADETKTSPGTWYDGVSSAVRLFDGSLSAWLPDNDGSVEPRWGIGVKNSAYPFPIRFSSMIRFELRGDWKPPSVTLLMSTFPKADGQRRALSFDPGNRISISNLCGPKVDDGDDRHELDVLAFYELSKSSFPVGKRKVLHDLEVVGIAGGNGTKPHQDACPPAVAYRA